MPRIVVPRKTKKLTEEQKQERARVETRKKLCDEKFENLATQ